MEEILLRVARSVITTSLLLGAVMRVWISKLVTIVPEPYLDEYFHVQQAELYLQGQWDVWHPKITTPPGLYFVSYVWISLAKAWDPDMIVNASTFRYTNFYAAIIFLVNAIRKVLFLRASCYEGERGRFDRGARLLSKWSIEELNHALFNICIFPPLFFFYGLFYTDVISALSVIVAYQAFFSGGTKKLVAIGLASLFFRQTNIFWVSIFLGGLEVSRTLFLGRPGVEFPERATVSDVIVGSWQHSCIYDPLISQAWIEDYMKTGLSVAIASLSSLPKVPRVLTPYLLVLCAFAAFVSWNGGVVLGDKENHIASLHLAQMLYIWPYFTFFSFPLIYPYLLNSIVPLDMLPKFLRSGSTQHQLPRLTVIILIAAIMLAIVHYNTIIHPFTLADNRHYMFYVFRLLLRHPLLKYAAVPIYILCGWAAITSLGGLPDVQQTARPPSTTRIDTKYKLRFKIPPLPSGPTPGNRVSFALAWLLATSLSLVTAPLVEPRYFILPWLIWRIHIPTPRPESVNPEPIAEPPASDSSSNLIAATRAVFYQKHDHRLWLETAWFLAINWATGYVFLNWGFEWPQDPGSVQRFMW